MSQDSCSEKDEPGVRGGGDAKPGRSARVGFFRDPTRLAT